LIPFERAWPYDIQMKDVYVPSCPFCKQDHVLLPLRPHEISEIQSGMKRLLVFPCCHNKVTLIDADQDYLLTNTRLR